MVPISITEQSISVFQAMCSNEAKPATPVDTRTNLQKIEDEMIRSLRQLFRGNENNNFDIHFASSTSSLPAPEHPGYEVLGPQREVFFNVSVKTVIHP